MIPIIAALTISTPAHSEYRFEFEHWYGQSFSTDDGNFNSCIASLHNSNDQLLLIKLDRDFDLSIGVSDYGWEAKLGDTVPVKAWLDHRILYNGTAIAISKDVYYMQLTQLDRSLRQMRAAKKLLIQIRKQSVLFNLKGMTQTLNSLNACVKHELYEHSKA
jgi:hypothetical protein